MTDEQTVADTQDERKRVLEALRTEAKQMQEERKTPARRTRKPSTFAITEPMRFVALPLITGVSVFVCLAQCEFVGKDSDRFMFTSAKTPMRPISLQAVRYSFASECKRLNLNPAAGALRLHLLHTNQQATTALLQHGWEHSSEQHRKLMRALIVFAVGSSARLHVLCSLQVGDIYDTNAGIFYHTCTLQPLEKASKVTHTHTRHTHTTHSFRGTPPASSMLSQPASPRLACALARLSS